MDYFDSKVYKVKNYIDEINQEIEDLKKVEYTFLFFYYHYRKISKRKNIYRIQLIN